MNKVVLIVLLILLLVLLLGGIIFTFIVSSIVYKKLLVRYSKDIWGRNCSMPEDHESLEMFNEGVSWANEYIDKKTEVHIVSCGYNLYGQYFKSNSNKCAIIIGGRMESCMYSYYFAKAYYDMGYNILVIDSRSHGYSDGLINCLGYVEYKDVLNWSKYMHDEFNNDTIVYHGICIGSNCALMAITNKECPEYVKGMIAEGMFDTFAHSFINHMKDFKKPIFPVAYETFLIMRIRSHADVVFDGPIKRIKKMNKPILFLHSKTDIFSTPDQIERVYKKCPSLNKRLAWFDNSKHSRIRYVHKEDYDNTIKEFLSDCIV